MKQTNVVTTRIPVASSVVSQTRAPKGLVGCDLPVSEQYPPVSGRRDRVRKVHRGGSLSVPVDLHVVVEQDVADQHLDLVYREPPARAVATSSSVSSRSE